MDNITLTKLAEIIEGKLNSTADDNQFVNAVSIDSRRIGEHSVFFPLQGATYDGHQFIADAFANGAAAAIANTSPQLSPELLDKPIIFVDESLAALQRLAAWWRSQIQGKLLAITGSNGKTIVKDALLHILSRVYRAAGSPDSFNSQIGVPLSVLRIPRDVEFAVLEAGISSVGEMTRLEQILKPDFGIITMIGFAHISSFGSRAVIAQEKVKLFENVPPAGWLLVPSSKATDHPSHLSNTSDEVLTDALKNVKCRILEIGNPDEDLPIVESRRATNSATQLIVQFPSGDRIGLNMNTPSLEIVSDVEIAICAAHLLGVNAAAVEASLADYAPGNTRMEIWKSPAGFTLINDSCSSDPISVSAALRSLASITTDKGRRFFVFGGMRELGSLERGEHASVGDLAAKSNVDTLILVGKNGVDATAEAFSTAAPDRQVVRCETPQDVKAKLLPNLRWGDTVLVKGPRNMGIAVVAREVIEPMGPNRFLVDLQAVNENITRFKRVVGPKTRILAMVKALAYGTDESRLALELQRMDVDSFGVASADEGAALRRAGIELPILVMMCSPTEADKLIHYDLTPMIYSFEVVEPIARAAREQGKIIDVHLEVDTGLGRLGVRSEEASDLARTILNTNSLRPVGLMTHFASADDPSQDDFSAEQVRRFEAAIESLRKLGIENLICHASATAATSRLPQARFDMVRLGLGMYGICPSAEVSTTIDLELAIALVSRVVKINRYKKGDRIGYSGTFVVPSDDFVGGVVPLGYHDGIPRNLSNRGTVLINGRRAGIIGNISMDSMMVDLSGIPDVDLQTDVLVYGKYAGYLVRPESVAEAAATIPYELLARIGPRVQRVFTGWLN
jgi:Alr-MurF fusion protein